MIKDVDIAWLAGIIDGEGCIYGHWCNRGRHSTGGNFSAEVRVEATSLRMIKRIAYLCEDQKIYFTMEMDRFRKSSTRAAHRINIRRRVDILKFLNLIKPYLIVKLEEAELVISWYETWGDQRGKNKPTASYDEKVLAFNTLKELKKTA